MFRHIVPTIRGLSPHKDLRAEKRLKVLGEFLLGADNIIGCVRVGSNREVVAEILEEANKVLSDR
jgi:hypothetical protein